MEEQEDIAQCLTCSFNVDASFLTSVFSPQSPPSTLSPSPSHPVPSLQIDTATVTLVLSPAQTREIYSQCQEDPTSCTLRKELEAASTPCVLAMGPVQAQICLELKRDSRCLSLALCLIGVGVSWATSTKILVWTSRGRRPLPPSVFYSCRTSFGPQPPLWTFQAPLKGIAPHLR